MDHNRSRTWHVVYRDRRPFGVQVTGTPYEAAGKSFGPFGSFIHAGQGELDQQVIVHDRHGRLLGTLFAIASPKARREQRMAQEQAR